MDALGIVMWKWWGFPIQYALSRGASGGSTPSYDWVLTMLNGNSRFGTIDEGEQLTVTVEPGYGYVCPTSITVKMGGSVLPSTDYSYDASTGEIIIPSVEGDVDITGTCPVATWEQAKSKSYTWEGMNSNNVQWQ